MSDTIQSNLVSVLAAMTGSAPGGKAFASVQVVEDLAALERIAGLFAFPVCGVIAKVAEWGNATDNAEDHVERLEFVVAIKMAVRRAVQEDDTTVINGLTAMAEACRARVLSDTTRGGLASPIRFNGRFMRDTDLRGPTKIDAPKKGHQFYTATFPVVCGLRVERVF